MEFKLSACFKSKKMLHFSKKEIEEILDYPSLINNLRQAFQENYVVPQRHHHNYENLKAGTDSTLLLMPAWESEKFLGVKMVTVSPKNSLYQLPAIQGLYVLFDLHKGNPLALMDAKTLTARRTAAASALASDYLAPQNSRSLLMIGTGALAPELIQAHASIRPIETVFIWGRNFEKAKKLANEMRFTSLKIQAVNNIEMVIQHANIISCATLSKTPLIQGKWLSPGQHIDLVGSYLPDTREADDEVILRTNVFVDTPSATHESGDLFIPIQKGILDQSMIKADLFNLCRNEKPGRSTPNEITLFKSVGHALEDLAAAKMIYQQGKGNKEYPLKGIKK